MNDAVKGLTSCVVGVAKDIAESGTSVASKSAAKWLGHVGWIMIATDLAVSTAINLSQYSPRTASHVFLAPPPPLTDGAGGSLLATAPGGGDGRYIARLAGSRQSWLVLPPDSQFDFWHAEEIASADTWNCWAEGLFLMDDVDSYIKTEMEIGSDGVPVPVNKQYLNLPGDPVVVEQPPIPQSWEAGTCNRATLAKWNFASVAQGGNVPSGVILKEPEWISRSTYYVKPDGQLVNIAEGGTYLCLAAKVPVIANFTRSHIDQWQPQDLTEKAVCP